MDTPRQRLSDTTNCTQCLEGEETIPATGWCSACNISLCGTCHRVHGRISTTRHHDTIDLTEEIKVVKKLKVTCEEHEDESINSYCKDCKKTVCQKCCFLYHSKCDSVTSLQSLMPEVSETLKSRKTALGRNTTKAEEQLVEQRSRCEEVSEMMSTAQSQIRATAQKAIDAIANKEKQLMTELDEATSKQMHQLQADVRSTNTTLQIYKHQSHSIDQVLNSDRDLDMFDLYQSTTGTADSEDGTDLLCRQARTRIEFSKDGKTLNKVLDSLLLGKVKVIHEGVLDVTSVPVLTKTIDIRTNDDKLIWSLYDMQHMDINGTDTFIVTDNSNSCIKSFYMKDGELCHSRLELESRGKQIAKLEGNKVAVPLSEVNRFVTIAVNPELSLVASIKTSKEYVGLTALSSTTLAASCQFPSCVDIIDVKGNVLKSIRPRKNRENLLDAPDCLRVTEKGNILVSDNGHNQVLCLTPQGQVVFIYSHGDMVLNQPTGIVTTATGDILVLDRTRHKVVHLSESGQFLRNLLTEDDGVQWSDGLDYDEGGNVYVTHMGESIQVYTFK